MKNILTIILLFTSAMLFAQFPNNPVKVRLGYQTTAKGLIYYGNGVPSSSPTGFRDDAFAYVDTLTNTMYLYGEGDDVWTFLADSTYVAGVLPVIDSTRLLQDSIVAYYQGGSEIGRDTLGLSVPESDPIYAADSASIVDRTELADSTVVLRDYTDDAEQAAKDYADANDSDNQTLGDVLTEGNIASENIALDGNYISGDGDNEGIQVSADGNVGINTTPSSSNPLKVIGTVEATTIQGPTAIFGRDGSGYVNSSNRPYIYGTFPNNPYPFNTFGNLIIELGSDREMLIVGNNSGTLSEVMNIKETGNIGIGTTSPSELLDVNGTVKADALDVPVLFPDSMITSSVRFGGVGTGYTGKTAIYGSQSTTGLRPFDQFRNLIFEADVDREIIFATNDGVTTNEQLVIEDGRIGIGRFPATGFDVDYYTRFTNQVKLQNLSTDNSSDELLVVDAFDEIYIRDLNTLPFYGSDDFSLSDVSNWNDAFGWGDHSTEGYLTTETDPVYSADPASSIVQNDIDEWNAVYDDAKRALQADITYTVCESGCDYMTIDSAFQKSLEFYPNDPYNIEIRVLSDTITENLNYSDSDLSHIILKAPDTIVFNSPNRLLVFGARSPFIDSFYVAAEDVDAELFYFIGGRVSIINSYFYNFRRSLWLSDCYASVTNTTIDQSNFRSIFLQNANLFFNESFSSNTQYGIYASKGSVTVRGGSIVESDFPIYLEQGTKFTTSSNATTIQADTVNTETTDIFYENGGYSIIDACTGCDPSIPANIITDQGFHLKQGIAYNFQLLDTVPPVRENGYYYNTTESKPYWSDGSSWHSFTQNEGIESVRNESVTTSGTGSITVSHSLGVIPSVTLQNASATPYLFAVSSVTTTDFTFFVYDTSGTAVASTSINFDYQLIIP